jgi:hypothetical protein
LRKLIRYSEFVGIRVQWFPTPIAPQFFVANKMEVHMPAFLYDLFQKWLYPEARK